MISAAWDWYYGSQDEELLADCEFGEPFSTRRCSNKDICMRPARLNNGLQVTVFTQVKSRPKEETDLEKCSNRLKLLRHPNILRHIGIVTTETEVHLITERVSPLYLQFETVDANEVTSGIYDIAQAVNFLHEKAELTHNFISIESIYVTEGGAWKLSNFEHACPFAEAAAPFLKNIKRLKEIIPPEEGDNMVAFPIERKYAHCRDVYALGILLGMFHKQTRFASEIRSQELEDLLEEILQKDFRSRPKVSELLDTAVLASDYIEIVNFLQSITLKSKPEKVKFFSNLIPRLKKACISDELIAKRIAKLLLSPVVLAETEAVKKIIPYLLAPIPLRPQVTSHGLVSSPHFARYVIPQIVDLLDVKILHVRLVLVSNFHRYVHMFDKSVLQDSVLPEILLGLHDSNNQLVKASLHALADAVPIVGGDMIVGTEREKIFGFGMPKFNGTVLVDASSLAFEMKPKRKPKKPKRKSPQRAMTLLELAMRREKSPSKVTKAQRDFMMLKQSELATTLEVSETNGTVPHVKNEEMVLQVAYDENRSTISSKEVKKGHVPPSLNINGNAERKENPKLPKSPQISVSAPRENSTDLRQKELKEPEIETWAASGSEDEAWVDFDDFGGDKPAQIDPSSDGSNTEPIGSTKYDTTPENVPSTSRSKKKAAAVPSKTVLTNHTQEKRRESDTPSIKQPIQDLGNEFEISVKLQQETTSSEPDFFSDMTPDIPARKVPMLPSPQTITRPPIRSGASSIATESTKSSPISVSFAVADLADDEATDGWDNDTVAWDD